MGRSADVVTDTGPWTLETERLGMREFERVDRDAVLRIFADPYARRFFPDYDTEEMADRWIDRNTRRYEEDGHGLWAMVLKDTGEVIGDVGAMWQNDVDGRRELEVGYHVAAPWRQKGFATEGAAACLEHALRNIDCDRVVSMVHPENEASHRVAARIHRDVGRFMRHGSRYFLFFTSRDQPVI